MFNPCRAHQLLCWPTDKSALRQKKFDSADEATGRWRDAASVRRYEHVIVEEESRKAAGLPVEHLWNRKRRLKRSKRVNAA